MGIHPKEIIQKRGKKGRYTKMLLQSPRMTEGGQVLHLKLTQPQTEVTAPVASPIPSCSPCPQAAEPRTIRGERHRAVVSIFFPPQPSKSTELVLSCKATVHIPPCSYYSCQRDLPKHRPVRPQCMLYANQTPAKVPEASRLLSSANTLA